MNFKAIINGLRNPKNTEGKLNFVTIKTSPYRFSNKKRFNKNEL